MNKKQYLQELKDLLVENRVIDSEVASIIEDYNELYDEAIASGLSDEATYERLGSPSLVYKQLRKDLSRKSENNKIVALSPFIATIIFFSLGFGFGLWNFAWTAYLLIPITAIITNVSGKNKFVALSPFIAVLAFFALGFGFNLWHPGWLFFLIVPISGIIFNTSGKELLLGLLVFLVVIAFVGIVYYDINLWIYAWLLFLFIPFLAYLLYYKEKKNLLGAILILVSVLAYIGLNLFDVEFKYTFLVFLIPLIFAFLNSDIQIVFGIKTKDDKYLSLGILFIVIVYLLVSLVFGYWNITWIILLFIPMMGIFYSERFKHPVAYMPFVATIIFILLGYFFDLWHIAWLAYLLIPIVAILTEVDKDEEVEAPLNDEEDN